MIKPPKKIFPRDYTTRAKKNLPTTSTRRNFSVAAIAYCLNEDFLIISSTKAFKEG